MLSQLSMRRVLELGKQYIHMVLVKLASVKGIVSHMYAKKINDSKINYNI